MPLYPCLAVSVYCILTPPHTLLLFRAIPPKVTLTQAEGETVPSGLVYVGETVDGDALLAEDVLPEVVCARLGAPDPQDRGIGK